MLLQVAVCSQCGVLGPRDESAGEVIRAALRQGWQMQDGSFVCPACLELEFAVPSKEPVALGSDLPF